MNKVLLITRCSRFEHMTKIRENILGVMKQTSYTWCIVFDLNIIQVTDTIRMWVKETCDMMPTTIIFSGSNMDTLYGSNMANEALFHYQNKYEYAYLLDDDNALHQHFDVICQQTKPDTILFFSQIRRSRETGMPTTISVTNILNPENCLGWVDSAQFLIPKELLQANGGYADGYYIDGATIRELLSKGAKFTALPIIAAYYNYWTELV